MDEKYISKYETGEAVDRALDRGTQAMYEVEVAKGSTHDTLDDALNDLQGQINQIVRAPESGGDVAAEVAQARVGADATNYQTLKDRLDSEYSSLVDDISDATDSVDDDITNLYEIIGKRIASFKVSTSQHSSHTDLIPWHGEVGDKIYVRVSSSPSISPQRNGGIYTYLNDTGTQYGSILIDDAVPKEITLENDMDHLGIWVPALDEEHEIIVTIESVDSINNSIKKLSNDILTNAKNIETVQSDIIGHEETNDLIWSTDFWNTVVVNNGGYISADDGISIITDNRYGYTDYIDISDYMLIKLMHNVSESVTHRIYVYDENKGYLSKSEVFTPIESSPFIFTGYKHAKYMRFSITLSEIDTYGLVAVSRASYGSDNIKSLYRSISHSSESLANGKIVSPNIVNWDGMLPGTFVNQSDNETYFKEAIETGFMDISDFKSIKIHLNPNVTRGRAIKFYDSTDNMIQYVSLTTTAEVVVPENAVKMRMTIFSMTNDGYSDIPYIKFYGIYGSMDAFVNQPYQGKKISILGDSISTFSGWLYPSENVAFYTGNNAGVSAVTDTWWYKLITALGATLEKNNSWSGSAVSNCRGSSGPKTGIQRCTNLGNPDVIIIRMGTNDFYFGAELGTYDGTTAIPTSEVTFSDAFAKMLDMIMTAYKTSEIWVCTMTQFERIGNVGYPETNSHGETIAEWNERIRKIARALGAKILDDAMCGMTYQNIGVYTDDQPYETTGNGLHPNAAGMSLIANNCIRTMDASTRIRY